MSLETEPEEVLKQYLKIASSYSIPLFWGTSDLDISANGTAFVLDTGESKFVVTAAHVYRSYLEHKHKGEVKFCQLKDLSFDLENRLIAMPKSDDIDIATFEISQQEIESIGANVLRGSNQSWPPSRPIEGNMVVVSGFPGLERSRKEVNYHSFGYYCFNTPVSSVIDRHFRCSFDRKYWVGAFGKGLPPENYNMAGIVVLQQSHL
ncbi:MAG: hypothetical protein HRT38_13490 [Alteromonadaceae bacterium]|nr:hypothetical protein [Alteromonadaceae bacterium]